jgi:O-antigen ligase
MEAKVLEAGASILDAPTSPGERTSLVGYLLRLALIFTTLLFVVDGALFQIEMFLTGGSVPITPSWILLLIGIYLAVLLVKGIRINTPILLVGGIVLAFCALDALFLGGSVGLTLDEIHGALVYMIPFSLPVLAACVPMNIRDRDIYLPLTVFLIACFVISVMQFSTGLPIVYESSLDGKFIVTAVHAQGEMRAFSLFGTALQAGIFYCFTGAVGFSMIFSGRTKLYGSLVLIASAFGCYSTLTRLMLIIFVYVIGATFVLSGRYRGRLSLFLPLLSVAVGALSIFQSFAISGGSSRSDLANTSSMAARFYEWAYYGDKFIHGSVAQIFLGQGMAAWQPSDSIVRSNAAPIAVDNGYLLILMSSGLLGLFVVLLFLGVTWKMLHDKATKGDSSLQLGTAAIFSSIPLFMMISDFPIPMMVLAALSFSTEYI